MKHHAFKKVDRFVLTEVECDICSAIIGNGNPNTAFSIDISSTNRFNGEWHDSLIEYNGVDLCQDCFKKFLVFLSQESKGKYNNG
jgi:hypothetical protein